MAADDVRGALDGALLALWTTEAREDGLLGADESLLDAAAPEVRAALDHFTSALLPTVERLVAEAKAEALRKYAEEETEPGGALRRRLLARAAAAERGAQ